jgi:siroheme synthase
VHGVKSPALIMIGGVVSLHEQLGIAGTSGALALASIA